MYNGFRFICIGMFISEFGRESNLKLVAANDGLSGFILCEQEAKRINQIGIRMIPFSFIVSI